MHDPLIDFMRSSELPGPFYISIGIHVCTTFNSLKTQKEKQTKYVKKQLAESCFAFNTY